MTPDEQTTLLDALLDGEISEADFIRLEAELSVDAEVRQAYYKRLQMELLLEEAASENALDLPAHIPATASTSFGRGMWLTGILIAIAAGLIAIVSLVMNAGGDTVNRLMTLTPGNEPSATGFAVLSGQSDAVWEGGPISNGALLPEGDLHLVSGLVHVELFSGVQMVVQGDAIFSIDSPMQVSMQQGRARAHVPEPAHGFRLKTSAGEVIDLGTEFTVDVGKDHSRVKVVDGEVELRPLGAQARRLRDGEGFDLSSDGTVSPPQTGEIDLISPEAFHDALAKRQSGQFRSWQESIERLRNDPRLLAHYLVDPDSGWSRKLMNRASVENRKDNLASVPPAVAGDGAVVAAARTKDRWGRTGGALDFSPMGSRVRVVVPGQHRGLTLMCWVKINSLDRWYNSLFLTDGHEDREPHWQIMNDGRMFFSVKPPRSDELSESELKQQVFYSEPFWDTSMSGQWMMLATVYDVDLKQVTHFVNGNPISKQSIPDKLLVDSINIGDASVCNWSQPMYRTDATFVVRNLNGCVDEFALFSGALSADEISNLFLAGNPNEQ